jgi:hypothetical protein
MEQIRSAFDAILKEQGGVTRLARLMNVPVTTVHKWKGAWTGRVPCVAPWPQIEQAVRTLDEFKELGNGAGAQ